MLHDVYALDECIYMCTETNTISMSCICMIQPYLGDARKMFVSHLVFEKNLRCLPCKWIFQYKHNLAHVSDVYRYDMSSIYAVRGVYSSCDVLMCSNVPCRDKTIGVAMMSIMQCCTSSLGFKTHSQVTWYCEGPSLQDV